MIDVGRSFPDWIAVGKHVQLYNSSEDGRDIDLIICGHVTGIYERGIEIKDFNKTLHEVLDEPNFILWHAIAQIWPVDEHTYKKE